MHKNHNIRIIQQNRITPKFLEPQFSEATLNDRHLNETQNSKDSFKNATKLTMTLGQYVCLIPFTENFEWCNIKMFLSIVAMICQVIMAGLSILWFRRGGISVYKSGYVLFFGGAALMMYLMIRLTYMWSMLSIKWEEIEIYFGYQKGLKKTFALISIFITVFSTVEYLSNLIVSMVTTSQTTSKVLKTYSSKMFPEVFEIVHYTMWRAIPIIYINSVSTLIYSFGDQIIIMISLAMGNYFKMFNENLHSLKGKNLTTFEWKDLRLKYNKLCELAHVVDKCLCHLLCLTFLLHLYVICVELHQGMLYKMDGNDKVHAILTFVISILRACALCYFTVAVYEQSKHLPNFLYSATSLSYCTETELLMQQALKNETALTGSHLFSMKKSFLLTIAGTVISYEILLLQMRDFSHADLKGIMTKFTTFTNYYPWYIIKLY